MPSDDRARYIRFWVLEVHLGRRYNQVCGTLQSELCIDCLPILRNRLDSLRIILREVRDGRLAFATSYNLAIWRNGRKQPYEKAERAWGFYISS